MKIEIEVVEYFEEHIQIKTEVTHCSMTKRSIDTYKKSDFESVYKVLMKQTLKTFEREFKKTIIESGEE